MKFEQDESRPLSILIADDHELIRSSLRELFEEHRPWSVCGEASNGAGAVAQAALKRPDVAVLDMSMPELNGLDAARQIRSASPRTELLLLTGIATQELVRDAFECGVGAVALKTLPTEELLCAVEALEQHERFLSKNLLRELGLDHPPGDGAAVRVPRLTPREREVMQLLADGKTNWCVAAILSISVKTVETHRAKILEKLHLESTVDLVHYAIRNGLIEP
jgi:DNA-binding NarL/FixJ family response regulator